MRTLVSIIALAIMFGTSLHAKTIWQDRNLYTSEGDIRVGNIIVVDINDISEMRFTLSMNNTSKSVIASNPDMTITGFLPKITSDKKVNNEDKTQFQGKGKLNFSMATRVQNKLPNGMFEISGSRTYTFSGVTSIITVVGFVDPAMVKGRKIDSRNVADFTLTIRGVKEGIRLQRNPLKEGDTASTALTEQEKQQIIIDYLQKMLGELTR